MGDAGVEGKRNGDKEVDASAEKTQPEPEKTTRDCYTGPKGTEGVGVCKFVSLSD